jgi:hypothetical protein
MDSMPMQTPYVIRSPELSKNLTPATKYGVVPPWYFSPMLKHTVKEESDVATQAPAGS